MTCIINHGVIMSGINTILPSLNERPLPFCLSLTLEPFIHTTGRKYSSAVDSMTCVSERGVATILHSLHLYSFCNSGEEHGQL